MADSEVRQKFEAPSETPDAFEQAWKQYNSRGNAAGWEEVAFTSGFGKGFEAGMRAGEIARTERSDKDYAIEHAEYLAKAAEAFLRVSNERAKAAEESEDVEGLMNADELLSDHWRALNSAIYEFRKRALRALPAAPEEKK